MSPATEDTPVRSRLAGKSSESGPAFLTMTGGEAVAQVAKLVRGIIIARILGPEMMGIAFSMLIIIDFLERMLNLNPAVTLIQDEKGASRKYRSTLQTVLLLRGCIFALLALILAWPLAWLSSLDQPEYLVGFFAVAAIPLLRSLRNVDVLRQLRKRKYMPTAITSATPELVSMISVIFIGMVVTTYWLSILSVAISSLAAIVIASIVAKRRFRLGMDRDSFKRIIIFIIPLIAAGLIVFFSLQGTRMVIQFSDRLFDSTTYSMQDVAFFGIAMTLCLLPESVGSRIITNTWNPQLSRLREQPDRFREVFVEMQSVAYMLATATMVLLGAGTVWVLLLYDPSYAAAGPLVAMLSVMGGMRLGRSAMRAAALSTGRSSIILKANIAGLLGFVGACIVIAMGRPLIEAAFALVIGEVLSFITGNIPLARGKLALKPYDLWIRPALFCGIGVGIAWLLRSVLPVDHMVLSAFIAIACTLVVIALVSRLNPGVRRVIKTFMSGQVPAQ